MTHQIFNLPPQQPLSAAGRILPGNKVSFFLTTTATPTPVYTTSALTTTHTQPVTADSGGRLATIFLDPQIVYKATVTDANDVLLYTVDPVNDQLLSQSAIGEYLYPQTDYEDAAGVTPISLWYPPGNAFRYMTAEEIEDVSSNTGAEDVTDALNNCTLANRGYSVFLPFGTYRITDSINVYNQLFDGQHKERTIINPGTGNFKALVNTGNEFITGHIRHLTVRYNNGVQPTNVGTQGEQFAIYFTGIDIGLGVKAPNFFDISDVLVQGAWWAYYDDSGNYGSTLERVFAQECQKGFYKATGTTMHFKECICLNVNEPFTMVHHLGLTMTCCAQDGANLTAGNAANTFDDCAGLVINGWDSEGNDIDGDGTRLFYFKDSNFTLNGWVGYLNTMSCDVGELCSVFEVENSVGNFHGCRPIYTAGSLTYTGSGTVATLNANTASKVWVSGCDMSAATGGTPAVRYSMVEGDTSHVQYANTTIASGDVSTVHEIITDSDTATGTLTGCTTSPTGTVRWTRNGDDVMLYFPDITGTSNATTCTITGAIPSSIYPARAQNMGGIRIQDNSVRAFGLMSISTSGVITLFPSALAGSWTAANTKGIESCTVTYSLD